MNEETNKQGLISKKELLLRYGISYGALYRWKRIGLIPSEWFVKMASPTGQETYFNEEAICQRIELILASKDSVSLENLAKELKPEEEKTPKLVIETTSGRSVFFTSDVKEVYVCFNPEDTPAKVDLSEQVIAAMQQLIERSHSHE